MGIESPTPELIESLRFEGLSFGYEGQSLMFNTVDFDFPMSEFAWIRAESGTGRSTLLQLMAALVTPNSGAYYVNGENTVEMSFEEFLPYRLSIGYAFDSGGLLSNRTLRENLLLPLEYHKLTSPDEAHKRVQFFMEQLGIWQHRDVRPATLTGSVRKLACLARAMIHYPSVLLLDDPSVGLGRESRVCFIDLVNHLRKQGYLQSVFCSSFDDQLIQSFQGPEVVLDEACLHHLPPSGLKKVVSL